jgi:UPF0755 protein
MTDRRQPDRRALQPRLPGLTPRSASELMTPTRPPTPAETKSWRSRRLPLDPEARRPNGFLRFVSGLLTFLLLISALGGGVGFALRQKFDVPGPLAQSMVVVIPKGEGTYEIAGRLEREGVVTDRRLFMAQYLAARTFSGAATEKFSIKAGEYEIKKAASLREVLDTLIEGKAVLYRISIPEGLTSKQIVDRLRADQNLSGEIAEVPAEGSLLPDTHRIARGTSRQDLIERMQADQRKLLALLWSKRQAELPIKTPEQAVVLASIIERETARHDERPKVAAVFVNRLRKNMRLQSDPTIIYGLVGGQGSLGRPISRADIDSKTPYNTYQIDGLPPGPIANPGRPALEAALNPASTQDLYFVADGTGGHAFTTNLKDHNAAVANWRRIEREQKEKSRPASTPAAPEPNAGAAGATEAPPAKARKAVAPAAAKAKPPTDPNAAAAAQPAKK